MSARLPAPPRPRSPPPRAVAEDVLTLAEWIDEDAAILRFARSIPAIAGEIEQLEAQRLYDGLREGGVRSTEAVRQVAQRLHKSERQVWRLVLTE